ncbi:hypothetical protein B0H21DRAFT_822915 [Amylocystis lapponica]|nr:hypothetical protein B0H21DRAFT_822915 [Amylocystis lapponica]
MRKRLPPLSAAFLVALAKRASAGNVSWISPSAGDVYASGDTIVGRWSADDAMVSPSFSLCVSGAGGSGGKAKNCGSTVWPVIDHNDGSYMIHLSLPDLTSASASSFYLQMADDSGQATDSPAFSLSPGSSLQMVPDNTTSASSDPTPPSASSSSSSPQSPLDLGVTRMPTPTAAYAVPLSLVISVLLAAGGLSIHQHRKLSHERAEDEKALSTTTLSRQSSLTASFRTLIGSANSRPTSVASPDSTPTAWLKRSGSGGSTLKRAPARRATREPFYTPSARRRPPMRVPASLFRAAASPMPVSVPQLSLEDEDANAEVEDSVVSRYFHPSPIPPPLPERLHVRRSAGTCGAFLDVEKPLPMSPGELYDEVAKRLSGPGH